MDEQTSNSSAAFMEVTSRKVQAQDIKIALLEEKLGDVTDNTDLIKKLETSISELRADVKSSRLPMEKLTEFSRNLDFGIACLRKPVENKVLHHHHVHKLIWITTGLFFAFSLACTCWYNTAIKLDGYIANDTKYRYLRLDTAKKALQFYIVRTDSIYNMHPDMRKFVLETEKKYQQNFERLIRAERLKAEAKDLEKSTRNK